MSPDANKDIARRFIEEVFVRGDEAAVDRLVAVDFQPHSWGPMAPGREALKQAQRRVHAGLSDARMVIEDLIAEGDRVAIRLTASGRHTGDFMGMKASGKSYTIPEIHILRIRDGKVAEHWREADMMGMMKQLQGEKGGQGS